MNWDDYIETASAIIDLPVPAEHKPGVAAFLSLAAEFEAVLQSVPFDDSELSLAPVFTPPDPADGNNG